MQQEMHSKHANEVLQRLLQHAQRAVARVRACSGALTTKLPPPLLLLLPAQHQPAAAGS
jgi:hypothetical protein